MLWSLIPNGVEFKPSERRWLLAFSVLVMALTTLPYLLGFELQDPDWGFTGFVFGVDDGNSYIAKMLSGAAGAWLFRTPYTTIPQAGVLAFPLYLLLGKLTSPPGQHLQLVVLFHLFRVLAGILAIMASYDFLALFLSDVRYRRWGLAIVVLGGGLGWVLMLAGRSTWLNSLPLEFYSPESFGFLALYGLPHLSLARAGLLWGLCGYLSQDRPPGPGGWRSWRSWLGFESQAAIRNGTIFSGLAWLVVGFAQPLTVVIGWWVVGLHLLVMAIPWIISRGDWRTAKGLAVLKYLRKAIWMGLISSPLVVYSIVVFRSDPFLQAWTAQNLILSPHPAMYLLAYGLTIPFAVLGARWLLQQNRARAWLPVAWVLSVPVLVYAPFNLQRRLAEGVWVALAVLAVSGWRLAVLRGGVRRWVSHLLVAGIFPSTAILIAGGILTASRVAEPVYRPVEEVQTFEYLAEEAEPGAVVLAAFETGNPMPAWAPVRVVVGHGPESVGLDELRPVVEAIYSGNTTDGDRTRLVRELDISYIYWGPAERKLGSWEPADSIWLERVYIRGAVTIFKTLDPGS